MAADKLQAYEAAVRLHADSIAKLEQAEKELVSAERRVTKRKFERAEAEKKLAAAKAELGK